MATTDITNELAFREYARKTLELHELMLRDEDEKAAKAIRCAEILFFQALCWHAMGCSEVGERFALAGAEHAFF